MTDNEIIKAWEKIMETGDAPIGEHWSVGTVVTTILAKETLDMLNRQKAEVEREHKIVCDYAQAARTIELYLKDFCDKKLPYDEMIADASRKASAEIERLHKLQKPTETSGFKIANGKVVFYTNILNGYRHEYKDLDEVVKELNLMLQSCYKCDDVVSHYKGKLNKAKSEAIIGFAERLESIFGFDELNGVVIRQHIDNLVKEMVGDE